MSGDGNDRGSTPISARACTVSARAGFAITSAAAAAATSADMPSASYIAASSAVSPTALPAIARRSTDTSRSINSFWAEMLIHSPAAIEIAPATAPARPASRTISVSTPEPAKPRISETFETSPSLMPNTAARASPPDTERCSPCASADDSASLRPDSVMR